MKIIYSDECLKYSWFGHVESPERVKSSYELLKKKGFEFVKPELAEEKDILRVRSKELIDSIKNLNSVYFSSDSPPHENIFYYASLAAGAAIKAMDTCFKENYCFSLMRPPGHHASKNSFGGFCYFNNIAISVAKALEEKEVGKVAILDIDIHHGNGTQDIFLNNNKVIYISLHQFPYYPGTGEKSERNCFNYPLPAETDGKTYLEILEKSFGKVKEFNPNLIAVSAGFDTYKNDPLSGLGLEIESYEKIAKLIKNLNKPCFSVLEGGYSSELGECIYSYLKGFE